MKAAAKRKNKDVFKTDTPMNGRIRFFVSKLRLMCLLTSVMRKRNIYTNGS